MLKELLEKIFGRRNCRQKRVCQEEGFVEKVINSLEYPFYVINREYEIVLCNDAARKKGVREGAHCYLVTHKRSIPCSDEHGCPLREVLEFKKSVIKEHIHFDKDGKEYFVEVHGDPILNEKGEVVNMIEYSIDITARKRAEEKLKSAYEQLKQAQSQLVQSAKMASVGLLAGGVAHEINNPLTGVLNNAQLLKMQIESTQLPPKDIIEYLNVINESAIRCMNIVTSLLEFSRAPTQGKKPVPVNESIEKVLKLIENEFRLESIIVEKKFEASLPLILVNPQLLQQVVFDIIANAKWAVRKSSPRPGGKLISLETSSNPQTKEIQIVISDNGVGIPDENLQKIFEPFFTTKEVGEGTGLGLAICYNIIKSQGGSIEVKSRFNEGTSFIIKFPFNNTIVN